MVLVPLVMNPEIPAVADADHENVVPGILEVSVIVVVDVPEQIVMLIGVLLTTGNGYTDMLFVSAFVQPFGSV